jgi:hypothetical protein
MTDHDLIKSTTCTDLAKEMSSETNSNKPYTYIQLSDEQKAVYRLIMNGYNIFFTGRAGSGKCWAP